jgi:hypothetical protein
VSAFRRGFIFFLLLSLTATLPLASDPLETVDVAALVAAIQATTGTPEPRAGVVRGEVVFEEAAFFAFWFPVVGNVVGGGGTHFKSDIFIVNYGNSAKEVLFLFGPRGQSNVGTARAFRRTIQPGHVSLRDIIGTQFQTDGLGYLLVTAVIPGTTTLDGTAILDGFSRIWTQQPGSAGTVSQSLVPVPIGNNGQTTNFSSAPLFAIGSRQDSQFRTNVGVASLDTQERTFRVDIQGTGGETSFTITVPGSSMAQVPIPAGNWGDMLIMISQSSPSQLGWTAYTSTVDNVTGDGWSVYAVP